MSERACSWCKKDLDTDQQLTDDEFALVKNHGICPSCYQKLMTPSYESLDIE